MSGLLEQPAWKADGQDWKPQEDETAYHAANSFALHTFLSKTLFQLPRALVRTGKQTVTSPMFPSSRYPRQPAASLLYQIPAELRCHNNFQREHNPHRDASTSLQHLGNTSSTPV